MFETYKYAILRVIPDARRGERVNIGVVVFRPNGVDVRILPSLAKVRALDARVDLEDLYSLPERIQAWLDSGEPPENQLSSLQEFGVVSVSDLGIFECRGTEYESNVKSILNTLVKPPAARLKQIQRSVDGAEPA